MRKLLFITLLFFVFQSCSKDDVFNPEKVKDGQVVTIYLNHYLHAGRQEIYTDNALSREAGTYVTGFGARELGYVYAVSARVKKAPRGLMDAPSYWFEYINTVSKTRVDDDDSFEVLLTSMTVGYYIALRKEGGKYVFAENYEAKPLTDAIAAKLDEVIALQEPVDNGEFYAWVMAKMSHDPDNWGSSVIVHEVDINILE